VKLPRVPSFRDLDQITIGLISMIAVAAAVTGIFAYGTVGSQAEGYPVSAVFTDTGGLKTGAEVRLAGVAIGSVTGIHADFELGQVVLDLRIDEGTQLGPTTRAEIAAATLLGGFYIRLTGEVEEPFLEDAPEAERRIPLERTRNPLSLVGTLSDTTDLVEAIDIDAVNDVMEQLAGSTERNADLVPTLLEHLTDVGTVLASREEQMRELIGNGEVIADTLADRDTQLVQLIDASSVLLETLTERRDELATILGSGSAAVAQLSTLLAEHRASIDSLLTDAHVFLDRVGANLGDINDGLGDAGPILSLLAATRSDSGGFDVAIEGIYVGNSQVDNTVQHLVELIEGLGLR